MIKSFTDLQVWQEAHQLVLGVYLLTRKFPKEEQFGLIIQLRRAAVSITSNIAEGFGRFTYKEKARFYYISSGSLSELMNQLLIAKDLSYITQTDYEIVMERVTLVSKLLHGLISKTKKLVPIAVFQSPVSNL
jgi:four helix bundle protein